MSAENRCPDDGACHHACPGDECWRVANCGPLSGVFPGNEWPDRVKNIPLCTKCRHSPCPYCTTWCDQVLWLVFCRECEKVACEVGRLLDGDEITCQHCGDQWNYDNDHDGDPELCCDGECSWDRSPEEVEAWCASYREDKDSP